MVRVVESLGILAFSGLVLDAFKNITEHAPLQALLLTFMSLPLAYFCADLLTGFIHWVCDSFGSSSTPVWGPMLVAPFRRHHRNPLEITRISLVENLGVSAIGGTLVLWLWHPRVAVGENFDQLFLWHLWLWFTVFGVLSNLFHRWSHIPLVNKPRWMIRLQSLHLILNTHEHLKHHKKPYRINFCILCGWANPLTNFIPWHRIESALTIFGIKTNFE